MQSIETYGFVVEFDEKNAIQYIELKDAIERLCRNAELYAKKYNKNFLVQYAKITNSLHITCAIINGKAEFGLYSKKTESILQYISQNTSIKIEQKYITLLQNKIEITAMNPHTLKLSPFKELWTDLFQQKGLIPNFDQQIER